MKVMDNLKIQDVGFCYLQYIAQANENQILKKHIKFGDSSYNLIKVSRNLKILDGGRPPCLIFLFAIHSLICGRPDTEWKHIKFCDYSFNIMKVMSNCQNPTWQLATILDFGIYSIQPKLFEIIFRRNIKVGDCSCSRMKVIGIL